MATIYTTQNNEFESNCLTSESEILDDLTIAISELVVIYIPCWAGQLYISLMGEMTYACSCRSHSHNY
jgi:hypothetical protein